MRHRPDLRIIETTTPHINDPALPYNNKCLMMKLCQHYDAESYSYSV